MQGSQLSPTNSPTTSTLTLSVDSSLSSSSKAIDAWYGKPSELATKRDNRPLSLRLDWIDRIELPWVLVHVRTASISTTEICSRGHSGSRKSVTEPFLDPAANRRSAASYERVSTELWTDDEHLSVVIGVTSDDSGADSFGERETSEMVPFG